MRLPRPQIVPVDFASVGKMDWIALIKGLLGPIIAECWTKTSAEDPQQVLRDAYDPATGRMESDLVRETMPATRRSARKARAQAKPRDRRTFKPLSRDEVYDISEQKLIEIMNAENDEVTKALSVARSAVSLSEDAE